MKAPTLSIIIPALNEQDNIGKLLRSIQDARKLLQEAVRGASVEVIVADAQSTDKTVSIARAYGARIVQGGMPAVGRNAGARNAKAKLLLFLDADTWVERDFLLQCTAEFADRALHCATCYTRIPSRKISHRVLFAYWNFWVWLTQKVYPHAPGYCIFVTKATHEKLHGFDESITVGEDADYARRAAKIGLFGTLQPRIWTLSRRVDREGGLLLAWKLTILEFHRIFLGEARTRVISYPFDHKTAKHGARRISKNLKSK